jgi:hypothetical protein
MTCHTPDTGITCRPAALTSSPYSIASLPPSAGWATRAESRRAQRGYRSEEERGKSGGYGVVAHWLTTAEKRFLPLP